MSRDIRLVARTSLTPIVWGTTYFVATELLPEGRPLLAACLRALPVGLAFVLWSRRLPTGIWWWRATALGALNIGGFFALLFVAALRLPGGVAATAGATQPLVAGALAAVILDEPFTRRIAIAGGAGLAGVALLVLGPDAALDPAGVGAAIGGAVAMALGVVLTKHWGRPVDLVTFTGWQLTTGGILLLPVVLAFERMPASITGTNAAGLAWLAIVGTGAAYANWFAGIQKLPITTVSILGLLSPVVATTTGWALLGEHLTAAQIVGAVAVLLAVATGQGRNRPARGDDPHRHDMIEPCSITSPSSAPTPPPRRRSTRRSSRPSAAARS